MRVRMAAPEHLLAVGQRPLVVRDGVLDLAFGQAGRGEPVPGGHGLRVARTLQALAVGQVAAQQPGGRRDIARGLVGGGELVPAR